MPVKRRYVYSGPRPLYMPRAKRLRGGSYVPVAYRPRISATRSGRSARRRMGLRMPLYRYHRYVSSITGNYAANYFDEAQLPFTLYPSTTTQTSYPIAYSFKFSDIANNSEFSNLYDSYMITGVACYIKLVNNPNVRNSTGIAGVSTAPVYPKLWYAIDGDDANVTDVSSLKEYGNVRCRTLQPNRITKIYVPYPKIATSVLGTGAVRSAGVSKPQWLDMAYTDIIHYGLKMALDFQGATIDADGTGLAYRVKLEFKYYFRCKDTR